MKRQKVEQEQQQEQARLLAERKAQMFSLSQEDARFRTVAFLQPGESSPTINRPYWASWWGYEVTSSCATIMLNQFFLLDYCAGQKSNLRDVAGHSKWRNLKFTAHTKPVEIKLWADSRTKEIQLSPDSPSLNVIVSPGVSVLVKIRGVPGWRSRRAKDLSWALQEGCAEFKSNDLISKFCPDANYRYTQEFGKSNPDGLKIRALESPVRISLSAHF